MRTLLLGFVALFTTQALAADFDWITDLNTPAATYSKLRLAWKRTNAQGVAKYRFRIWGAGVDSKRRAPRWETFTNQNWVDFEDLPPTSYAYLHDGEYAVEVLPVTEKKEAVGEALTGVLKVDQNARLPRAPWEINTVYGLRPSLKYKSISAITGNRYEFSGTSHQLSIDARYWFQGEAGRRLGLLFSLGGESLQVEKQTQLGDGSPETTVFFPNLSADLLWRTYLSEKANGWTSLYYAGIGIQEYPETELVGASPEALAVGRPWATEIRLGAGISKLWASGWQLDLKGQLAIPAMLAHSTAESSSVSATVNPKVDLRALKNFNRGFGMSFGLLYDSRSLHYNVPNKTADGTVDATTASKETQISLSGYAAQVGLHWNVY